MLRSVKVLAVFLVLLTVASCERNDCRNVVCPVNQQCLGGACRCEDGYEGTNCATESAQKYIGNYSVSETCYSATGNFPNYYSYITPGNYINQLYINDMFGMGVQCGIIIHTDESNLGNYVEIPYQTYGAMSFSGQGNFDSYNYRMTLNLNYTFNGNSYQCTHTFYKVP